MQYPRSVAAFALLFLPVFLGAGCRSSSSVDASREARTVSESPTSPTSQPSPSNGQNANDVLTPLPSNFPSDIPTAPNSMVINTSVDSERKIVKALLSSQDSSDRVYESLFGQLTGNGFSKTVDSTIGNTRQVIFEKGSLTMSITLIQELDVTNYEISREE